MQKPEKTYPPPPRGVHNCLSDLPSFLDLHLNFDIRMSPKYPVETPNGAGYALSKTALINGKLIVRLDTGRMMYCYPDDVLLS